MVIQNKSRNSAKTMSSLLFFGLIAGCGGSADDNAFQHMTGVADPDPQTPFFNDESTFQVAEKIGGTVSNLYQDVSKAVPADETVFNQSNRDRTVQAVSNDQISCDSGDINTSIDANDGAVSSLYASIAFNNCNNSGVVINGSMSVSGNFSEGSSSTNGDFSLLVNNFSVRGEENATMDGDVSIGFTKSSDRLSAQLKGNAFTITADNETTTFREYHLQVNEGNANSDSTMSADVIINNTAHGTINIKTQTPFTIPANAENPASGKMTMTHTDGSYFTLDADSGDAATFSYIIFDGSTTSSGIASWSELEIIELN